MKIGIMLRCIGEKQGIGVYAKNLMDHLLQIDTRNEYILFYQGHEYLGRYANHANVKEYVVVGGNKAVWDQIKVPLEARKHGVDVLFNAKFTTPLFTKVRTVMVLHGSAWFVHPEWYRPLDRVYIRQMMTLYCKKATSIISNSNMTRRDFVSKLAVPEKKIRTVYFGFHRAFRRVTDRSRLEHVRKKYQLPDRFILFVGRIDPGKNFEALLAAYAKLQADFGHALVVAGHPRWGHERILMEIERMGLNDKVLFPGWVDEEDLAGFYNMADLFVLPSYYEGFGLPALEAMACGCPAVVSRTGALPEITDGAAVLVDPNNPEDIAAQMRRCLVDRALTDHLRQEGLRRAGEFSWNKCAQETLGVLESLNGNA